MSPQRVSDGVCTPHHSGRAFDVAHGYPLPPAFERTLSIPISRHHDILLLIRRHRSSPIPSIPLSPISPKAEPPFFTTGPPRLAPHETAIRMSHFQIVSFQFPDRSATDHRDARIPAKLHDEKRFTLASEFNILISSSRRD